MKKKKEIKELQADIAYLTPGLNPDLAIKMVRNDPNLMFKLGMGGTINALALVVFTISPSLLPISFCILALTAGYVMRVIHNTAIASRARKESLSLPDWSDWLDLLISGLTWMAFATAQIMIIFFGLVLVVLAGNLTGSVFASANTFRVWWILSIIIMTILSVSISLLSTYQLTNLAIEEKISAAFDLPKLIHQLKTKPKELISAWLLNIGLQYAAILFPPITVVGIFFIPLLLFAAQITGGIALAQAWEAEN